MEERDPTLQVTVRVPAASRCMGAISPLGVSMLIVPHERVEARPHT